MLHLQNKQTNKKKRNEEKEKHIFRVSAEFVTNSHVHLSVIH